MKNKKIIFRSAIGLFVIALSFFHYRANASALSDLALANIEAIAGGDGGQWKYPLVWVEQYCGAWPDRWNDKCEHSGVGRESCEGYADGYTPPLHLILTL